MLYHSITDLIGNTPLLEIPASVHGIPNLELYAKLEYYNPFGSVKDRTARYLIKDHLDTIRHNKKIVESSSGNTAKSLTILGSLYGATTKTVTNRINVQEQLDILKLLGTDIQQLPGKSECIDFTQANNPVELIEALCEEDPTRLHTDQYRNPNNTRAHYETTWPEIFADIGMVDYVFNGLWTTGSSWWVTEFFREKNSELVSIGIVSSPDDFIPWIRTVQEMFEVWLYSPTLYSDIAEVNSLEALRAMVKLNRLVGMLCGPTTGAVFHGICHHFINNPITSATPKKAVFIACDRMEPYLSYIKQRMPEVFHHDHKLCILKVTAEDEKNHGKHYSPEQVEHIIQSNIATIIDIRSNKSFVLWHLPWSLNIPYEVFTELIDYGTIADPQKPLLLVCPIGEKTKKLCAYLNMLWLDASILEWWLHARKDSWRQLTVPVHHWHQ